MKKIINIVLLIMILIGIILGIIFWIKKSQYSRLIVVKLIGDGDALEYEDRNIVEFKNDIATTIETTMTFKNVSAADYVYEESMVPLMKDVEHNGKMTVQKKENVLLINNEMKSYVNYKGNFSKDLKKDEIKAWFLKQGYTIVSE